MSAPKQMSKAKTGANAVTFTALVLLGLVFLNVVMSRAFKRIDFTQDHVYTLSKASRDLVAQLPDRLTVKAYISNDLQPPFSQVAQYTRDLLDEFAQASNGRFKWEAVDPGTDPKLEEEAQKLGVPKLRRGRVSSNKLEIGSSFLGVAFQFQGKAEAIPEINSQEGLEYQMASLIKLLTQKKRKVAFATSEGELSPDGQGLQLMKQFLKEYDVVSVQLATGEKPIPDDAEALVVAGPKQPMSERAKFVIDQFIMQGKSVALLVPGMVVEAPKGGMPGMPETGPRIGRKNEAGLDDLLEHYGFKVHDDLVLEPRQNVPGVVPLQGRLFVANYPTFLAATKLDEAHPILDHVKAVVLPFSSSIEVLKDKQPGLTFAELASSTPEAWRQSGFFLFDPQAKMQLGTERGPFLLAASAQGKVKSFFAGKPYPNEKGEKVSPPDPNVSQPPGSSKPLDESVAPARIVVVGGVDFANDEYLQLLQRGVQVYGSNVLFFVNLVDYLAKDNLLAPLRAKSVQSRPITVASEGTPALVKYANVVGVPLVFIVFGVVRWRVRSARRRTARL